jgi:hypothetical protein
LFHAGRAVKEFLYDTDEKRAQSRTEKIKNGKNTANALKQKYKM